MQSEMNRLCKIISVQPEQLETAGGFEVATGPYVQ
jgi:hypothetical protein